jgi:hypothetical protein
MVFAHLARHPSQSENGSMGIFPAVEAQRRFALCDCGWEPQHGPHYRSDD